MKKPAIPSVASLPPQLAQVLGPIKENIEIMTGARGAPLTKLSSSAGTAEIITAINLIIARINATGS